MSIVVLERERINRGKKLPLAFLIIINTMKSDAITAINETLLTSITPPSDT